jgi:hypothetical protein
VGSRLVAGMLGLGLSGSRPPPAAPAAPPAARLVWVKATAKIQHQEGHRGRGADAPTPHFGD